MYQFAMGAIIKSYALGGLNSRNFFSHSPGDKKAETKVSAGLVPSGVVTENLFRPLSQLLLVCWQSLMLLGL